MLASMVCGQEVAHLRLLLQWADHKGSDVFLRDGCLLQGSAPSRRTPRQRPTLQALLNGLWLELDSRVHVCLGTDHAEVLNLTKFARTSATGPACHNRRRKNFRDGDTYVEAAIEIRRTSLRTTASLTFSVPETCAVGKVTLALATMVMSQVKVMLPSCLHALVPGLFLVFNPVTWSCTLYLRCPLCMLL